MKNLIPLLTPALALGTLVAALLGYFQWRKQKVGSESFRKSGSATRRP